MAFTKSLGDILFEKGWSLGDISTYIGPSTEARLIRDTGYDDTSRRSELCLDTLRASNVISAMEFIDALEHNMRPNMEHADPFVQPAPKIEAVLPSGRKIILGGESIEPN
jgi:hypothetical protein